jgi:hypothetical protein
MAVRFVPNPAFRPELESERPFKQGMGETTFRYADAIEVAALPFRNTGNFIARIEPKFNGRSFYVELERHMGHLSEFGSVNNPPQRNSLRAAAASDMRFEDHGPNNLKAPG